jgi:alkylated DNA repair dioxygenase AlkB
LADLNVTLTQLMSPEAAQQLYNTLYGALAWEQREISLYGVRRKVPRLEAWYGSCDYVYSGQLHTARPLPDPLGSVLAAVEEATGERFNSVLCNLYRDGSDSVAWHADDEPGLGPDPIIASVSLGAVRRFKVKPKAGGKATDFDLQPGSLLLMGSGTQANFIHCISKTKKAVGPRINLTFRYMPPPDPVWAELLAQAKSNLKIG